MNLNKYNKTVLCFTGESGSGKTYTSQKMAEHIKSQGMRIALIAFADPIKSLLRIFGLSKSGKLFDNIPSVDPEFAYSIITDYFIEILERKASPIRSIEERNDEFLTVSNKIYEYLDEFMEHYFGAIETNDIEKYKFHYRKLVTMVGTEIGRGINEEIWINDLVNSSLDLFGVGINTIFIDDLRFLNEFEKTKAKFDLEGISFEAIGVIADPEIRAKRQGITLEKLMEHSTHSSEMEVKLILEKLPKENIIINN